MRGSWPCFDHYIGERSVPATGDDYLPVYEPATGAIYAQVANATLADVDAAIRAASDAFPAWSALSPSARAAWLEKIAQAIDAQADRLAALESQDCGKPISAAARVDIPRAAQNFRFFAAQATTFGSESYAGEVGMQLVSRAPLGAVGCISPWNLPLYLLSWKIAPALAAGNTVVAKPSEITPATAHALGEICQAIGLPAGVLNIVQGRGDVAGAALVRSPAVKAVSFTGSTGIGRQIAGVCASQLKRCSLELGGKNASIVFADADFEHAVAESVRAAFSNQGQICLCGSRIFVDASIYPQFVEAFVAKTRALRIGDPADPATEFAALSSLAHKEKVLGYIDLAHQEGGRLLTGGDSIEIGGRCAEGYFVAPTVFDQLSFDARVNQEEIFGPVVTLTPFRDETQALIYANSTPYGLAATVFTRDHDRALRVAALLQAGLVWINHWMRRDLRVPFGGVKQSGLGREGGTDAMRFFTECKSISL